MILVAIISSLGTSIIFIASSISLINTITFIDIVV